MHPIKLRLSTLITAVVAVVMLAVAIDWSTPTGVAEADHGIATPAGAPTAATGNGTMTVSWSTVHGAASYEYRFTDDVLVTLGHAIAPEWSDEQSTTTDSVIIEAGTLTVGMTYYFQIRGKDSNRPPAYGEASAWSAGEQQRAAPPAVEDLSATGGNAEVTLTWTLLDDGYAIVNYQIRRNDAGGWGKWESTTSYTISEGTATDTVGGLTNGTTYSFRFAAPIVYPQSPHPPTKVPTAPPCPPRPPARRRRPT